MAIAKTLVAVAAACVIGAAALFALARRPAIDAISRPAPASFDPALVARGAQLASAGNCTSCHTVPGGLPYAGGLAVATTFGTIYSTNITPDYETGIGAWSQQAFARALRNGVDRAGHHLYPVFPYDHFALLEDADIAALYAFFMTREAVHATAPANEIPFPLNQRVVIAGWKLLFLRSGPYQPDPAQSSAWNRGAYLVNGLAHCGACHTPRNALGAEKNDPFAGGETEGWTAYALNASSPAPVPWDADALRFYLRNGWHEDHGIARGPMAPVIDNIAALSDTDLAAISTYLADILGRPSEERRRRAQALLARVRGAAGDESASAEGSETAGQDGSAAKQGAGAPIYQAACAPCHQSRRPLPFGGINLSLSTGPSGPNARNVMNVVLWGLPPREGERSPMMPSFAAALSDEQLTDLLNHVRSHFSDKPVWRDLDTDVRQARRGRQPVAVSPAHGLDPATAVISQGETR
jgi:mono/diheme cytochrome c family protein